MGEQNNLFEKLDKIQSGIEEMRQSTSQDETKLREFISNAERILIYNGRRSEYMYHKKNICRCKYSNYYIREKLFLCDKENHSLIACSAVAYKVCFTGEIFLLSPTSS